MTPHVLLLNADYSALGVCTVERAVVLVLVGKADLVHALNGQFLRSARLRVPVPSIVRLRSYLRVPYRRILLTRKNVLRRDRFCCQYCGTREHLTIDHVLPKSRGGPDTWENLVAACARCNARKGSRTPEEAHMPLTTRALPPLARHVHPRLHGHARRDVEALPLPLVTTRRQLSLFVPPDAAAPLEAARRVADPVQHALIGAHVTLCRDPEGDAFDAMLRRLHDEPFGPVRLVFGAPVPFGGHGWLLPCTDGHAAYHALARAPLVRPRHVAARAAPHARPPAQPASARQHAPPSRRPCPKASP